MVYNSSVSKRGSGRPMSSRPSKHVRELAAKYNLDEFQRARREELSAFLNDPFQNELSLDVTGKHERHLIHSIACELELRIQTLGDEYNRKLRVVKPQFSRSLVLINAQAVKLDTKQSHFINDHLDEYPIAQEEILDHLNLNPSTHDSHKKANPSHYAEPLIPPKAQTSAEMHQFRQKLPATRYRDQILTAISRNKVTIVTGGTGCGKTTQVPQFLLEEFTRCRESIRIVCTQPRRLPAITVAERVARERNEPVGETVGYHIRLEQKTSENTALTYCTSGVLLRMLSVDPLASGITHIILDEVHEREQNTDYLLIILRDALMSRPDLKVILMSATIEGNREMFENYFSRFRSCGRCDIPSRLFSVEKLYLPDILALTGYMPSSGFAGLWTDGQSNNFPSVDGFSDSQPPPQQYDHLPTVRTVPDLQSYEHQHNAMQNGWQSHPQPSHYIPPPTNQQYQHHHTEELTRSNTVPTNLQYAMQPGYYQNNAGGYYYENSYAPPTNPVYVQQQQMQPHYGYDNNWNMPPNTYYNNQQYHAQHYQQMPQHSISQSSAALNPHPAEMASDYNSMDFGYNKSAFQNLNSYLNEWLPDRPKEFNPAYIKTLRESNVNKDMLIKAYLKQGGQQWTESIDTDLALGVIKYCMDSQVEGSILVFLPGYDDIINLRDKVHEIRCEYYKPTILSTNIAEASLTIDDVVFVIDCGKVKEKTYEHNSRISQLKVSWIAKSNAEQRAGRAGRCRNGFCFRLYSQRDYDDMLITQVAEMRRSAIHELCLHAKMFAPAGTSVRRFLDQAPEPPNPQAIDRSLEFLEQLGALFNHEKSIERPSSITDAAYQSKQVQSDQQLTNLGRLIANLPLEPQLARLLLFGASMKVLHPIITLVAALSHREPFVLPPNGDDKMASIAARDKFSRLDYSDHLMLLRVLNAYTDLNTNCASGFCRQNYLSKPAILMILGIRRQLFHELKRLHVIPYTANSSEDSDLNQFSNSWPMIQGVIIAGSYPGIAFIRSGSKLRKIHPINCGISGSTSSTLASLHPSSSLRRQVQTNKRSDFLNECLKNHALQKEPNPDPNIECVVFQELSKIDEGLTLRTVTAVSPLGAFFFSGPTRVQKFIVDDFELGEEDFDAHFFNTLKPISDDEEAVREPNFEEDDSLPPRYARDYYVETDTDLCFRGSFRDLQSALRLRFKLLSYFLRFLEHPLQPLSREDYHMLLCVSSVLKVDHTNCYFNEVVDTMPKRPPLRNQGRFMNPPQLQRPAVNIPSSVERRRPPSPHTIEPPANFKDQDENTSDSPPADPAPTIQPPTFDPLPPRNVPSSRQRSAKNDAPYKKLLEDMERAQKQGNQRQDDNYGQNRNNDNSSRHSQPSSKRGFGYKKSEFSSQRSDERPVEKSSFDRDNEFDGRSSRRYKSAIRGRQFVESHAEQRPQHSQQDQRPRSLYVPPGRRNQGDVRRDRPDQKKRDYRDDVSKHMDDFKLDDEHAEHQNYDFDSLRNNRYPSDFNRRRGESSSFRGGRGTPKVFSNQMYKKRGGY